MLLGRFEMQMPIQTQNAEGFGPAWRKVVQSFSALMYMEESAAGSWIA